MATNKGVTIQFGISGSTSCLTGSLQTRDYHIQAEKEPIRDSSGQTTSKVWYDQSDEATFTAVTTGTGTNATNATLSVPNIGDTVTVSDALNSYFAGSNWHVEDVKPQNSNTTAQKVVIELSRNSSITT